MTKGDRSRSAIVIPGCTNVSTRLFQAGALEANICTQLVDIQEHLGAPPASGWNGKAIVGPPARPFAELRIVDRLERLGFAAGWAYHPGKFLSKWEPREMATLPDSAMALISKIRARIGVRAGCWDVFAWRKGKPLFVELKQRHTTDEVRLSQLVWREAALDLGVKEASFIVAEWSLVESRLVGGPD